MINDKWPSCWSMVKKTLVFLTPPEMAVESLQHFGFLGNKGSEEIYVKDGTPSVEFLFHDSESG
jgi:hypothetical protein